MILYSRDIRVWLLDTLYYMHIVHIRVRCFCAFATSRENKLKRSI